MQEQFVTYEITLALKELGFDEPCLAFYNYNNQLCGYINPFKDWNSLNSQTLENSQIIVPKTYTAPLWQQVIDWFREDKGVLIDVLPDNYSETELCWYIYIYEKERFLDNKNTFSYFFRGEDSDYMDFYQAREQAILKAIELCQKRK